MGSDWQAEWGMAQATGERFGHFAYLAFIIWEDSHPLASHLLSEVQAQSEPDMQEAKWRKSREKNQKPSGNKEYPDSRPASVIKKQPIFGQRFCLSVSGAVLRGLLGHVRTGVCLEEHLSLQAKGKKTERNNY